jgi:hypothetical protein
MMITSKKCMCQEYVLSNYCGNSTIIFCFEIIQRTSEVVSNRKKVANSSRYNSYVLEYYDEQDASSSGREGVRRYFLFILCTYGEHMFSFFLSVICVWYFPFYHIHVVFSSLSYMFDIFLSIIYLGHFFSLSMCHRFMYRMAVVHITQEMFPRYRDRLSYI